MKFKAPIEVESSLVDSSNSSGSAGQVLTSTGVGVDWINPTLLPAESAEKVIQTVRFGEAVSKGDPLVITGYQGSNGPAIVEIADATDATKMPAYGVALEDYANNATGLMIAVGDFQDFDTSSYSVGDTLYVAVGGGMTNVKPTGTALIQNMGIVSRSNANNGDVEIVAIGRTNDVPNLPEGRLFVGTATNTSLASDIVYVDEPNKRVGIRTATPSTVLEVSSSGVNGIDISQSASNASQSGRLFFTTNTASEGFALFNANGTFQVNSGGIPNDTSGTNRISIIGSSGNVGIGTTSPNEKLEVNGSVRVTGAGLDVGYGNNSNNFVQIGNGRTTNGFAFIDLIGDTTYSDYGFRISRNNGGANTNTDLIHRGIGFLNLNATQAGGITLKTSNVERVRVNSSGNVGIGTTNPTQKLHVNGNARLTGLFYDGTNSGGTNGQILSSDGGQTEWIDGSAIPGVPAGSGATNFLARWTPDNDTLGIGVTYDNGINVGIGTTSPNEKLDVYGGLHLGTTGNFSITQSPFATTLFYVAGGGNGGTIAFGVPGSNTQNVSVQGDLYSYQGSIGTKQFGVQNNKISYNGDNYLNSGNLGIGTTSPYAKLHVASTSSNNVPTAGTATGGLFVSNSNKTYGINMGVASSGWGFIQSQRADANTTLYNLNLQPLGGNVGIGTDSPSELLHISSLGPARLLIEADTDNVTETDNAQIILKQDGGAVVGNLGYKTDTNGIEITNQYAATDGILTFGTSGTERMRIAANGDVGIGTTSLTGISSTSRTLSLGATSATTSGGIAFQVSGGVVKAYNYVTNNYLINQTVLGIGQIFYGAGSERMRIHSITGNVGIGTTIPQSKLQVNGGVQLAFDGSTPSLAKVGTFRYSKSGNNTYVDMCMQTGASTYAWVNIVTNSW